MSTSAVVMDNRIRNIWIEVEYHLDVVHLARRQENSMAIQTQAQSVATRIPHLPAEIQNIIVGHLADIHQAAQNNAEAIDVGIDWTLERDYSPDREELQRQIVAAHQGPEPGPFDSSLETFSKLQLVNSHWRTFVIDNMCKRMTFPTPLRSEIFPEYFLGRSSGRRHLMQPFFGRILWVGDVDDDVELFMYSVRLLPTNLFAQIRNIRLTVEQFHTFADHLRWVLSRTEESPAPENQRLARVNDFPSLQRVEIVTSPETTLFPRFSPIADICAFADIFRLKSSIAAFLRTYPRGITFRSRRLYPNNDRTAYWRRLTRENGFVEAAEQSHRVKIENQWFANIDVAVRECLETEDVDFDDPFWVWKFTEDVDRVHVREHPWAATSGVLIADVLRLKVHRRDGAKSSRYKAFIPGKGYAA